MRGIYEEHSVICNGVTDERARFFGGTPCDSIGMAHQPLLPLPRRRWISPWAAASCC